MNKYACARASAVAQQMADKPPMMHFDEVGLLAKLRANRIDPNKVESIRYLGNRLIVYNAEKRFELH